jgi:DNA polymerase-3 subunit chi
MPAGTVRFYVQPATTEPDPQARWRLAARLCRRVAVIEQQPMAVVLDDPAARAQFDDWLWTYAASSFVPHALDNPAAPVNLVLQDQAGTVLNLGAQPLLHSTAALVLELVVGDEAERAQARRHYKAYQQAGWSLQTVPL